MFASKFILFLLHLLALFPLGWLQKTGRTLGCRLLKYDKRTTTAIDKNLSLCFPELSEEQHQNIKHQRLGYMLQTLFEMSYLWTKKAEQLRPYIKSDKNTEFKRAINSDESVMVLVLHQGNWEAMNAYLSDFRQITAMYRPLKNRALDNVIRKARCYSGTEMHPNNIQGIRAMLKALAKKGLVCILPDQVPDNKMAGVFAPLFNHDAYTMTLAHRLSKKSGAKVFISATYQTEGGFIAAVEPIDEGFYSDDEVTSCKALNGHIERFICRDIAQSQLEYKRYRSQAQGRKSLYQ